MRLNKVKELLNSQYFFLLLIIFIGLWVRLLNIDKPSGLWSDELLTYVVASKSFSGIWERIIQQDFHMPLYYYFVHLWINLFGSSDIVLRLSSVLWGVLSIPASFYLGKEYQSKSLGYLFAGIVCLSPIMIYFSQEFRFYSMLAFFSIISTIFFLKLLHSFSRRNFLWFFFANFIILYIYTMGIIFVFPQILFLIVYYYIHKKSDLKLLLKYSFVFLITILPYLILLGSYLYASDKTLLETFSWESGFKINALFSTEFSTPYNYLPITFGLSFCFLVGIVLNFINFNKKFFSLLFVSGFFLFVELFLYLRGNFLFEVRYIIIILPIILLFSCCGFLLIKNSLIKKLVIVFVLSTFAFNSIDYKHANSHADKTYGFKARFDFIQKQKIRKDDYILYPVDSEFTKKYIKNARIIEFSTANILYRDKTKKEWYKLFDKNIINIVNKHNAADRLVPYLVDKKPTKELTSFLDNSIYKMPKGSRLMLIDCEKTLDVDDFIRTYSQYKAKKISDKKYKDKLFYSVIIKTNENIKKVVDLNSSLKLIAVVYDLNKDVDSDFRVLYVYKKIN